MKKKILATLLIATMALSLVACGSSSDNSSDASQDETEATAPAEQEETEDEDDSKPQSGKVDKINLDNAEGTLVYTKHEVSTDYDGNPAIFVYFDYTNKKDETSYAQMTFYTQVFQNGVECDLGFTLDENEAVDNATKEIQKGTTLNIAFVYTLQDTENPVTLQVTDQSADNLLDDITQEQELALQ